MEAKGYRIASWQLLLGQGWNYSDDRGVEEEKKASFNIQFPRRQSLNKLPVISTVFQRGAPSHFPSFPRGHEEVCVRCLACLKFRDTNSLGVVHSMNVS